MVDTVGEGKNRQKGMMKCDVAIVGAGPAGSIAAHHLAEAGVQVVLLDKAKFPRDKTCGDGVAHEGLNILTRMGLGEWLSDFQDFDMLRLSSPNGQVLDIPYLQEGIDFGRTIPRLLLDARLVEAAVDAGAKLVEGVKVDTVDFSDQRPVVVGGEVKVDARLVILADGSQAPVTRKLGLARDTVPDMTAVRQYYTGDTGPTGRLELHFQQWVSPGYTWVFPLGDGRVNIGTGTFTSRVRSKKVNLREVLENFKDDPIIEGRLEKAEPDGPFKGFPLRTSFGSISTHADHLMVAGDAAGLVNPFTGEGITPALQSGEMAAAQAITALETGNTSHERLAPYSSALRSIFAADYRAFRILRQLINFPVLVNRLVKNLQNDSEMALLVSFIIIGYRSPRLAFKPSTIVRLLL